MVDHPVAAEGGSGTALTEAEAVLQALNQLKLVDALKGKSSTAGRGKQPLGEHKVSSPTCSHFIAIAHNHLL